MLQVWEFLAIKLVSVPIFILTVSMVAHKWGPSVGGVVLGLPLTSGPVLFFLALEQGTSFAAASALGTLLGLISLSASCIVFSWLSFRLGWLACLVGCCVTFFMMTLILTLVSFPSVLSLVSVVAFLLVICRLFPSGASGSISREVPKWEIPARMIAATGLVLLITGAGVNIGATLEWPTYAVSCIRDGHRFVYSKIRGTGGKCALPSWFNNGVPHKFRLSLFDCIFHSLAWLDSSIRVGCGGCHNDA